MLTEVHRLLVVEDDDGIAMPLLRTLQREGYAVERVVTGAAALERALPGDLDLIVLDLGLPDMDGLDVCRQARSQGCDAAILILTARGGELDRVVGLDVGADDYLPKPFALAELLARTRALLRRVAARPAIAPAPTRDDASVDVPGPGQTVTAGADHPSSSRDGDLRVDHEARRVWAGSREMSLTAKEFDLLALLDAHRGAVLTRERLMDEVWDENWFGSTKTLDVTVGRLRQKLDDSAAPARVVTVRGVGFRLETGRPDA
jgi:DNA-binding response OmpR family regulator